MMRLMNRVEIKELSLTQTDLSRSNLCSDLCSEINSQKHHLQISVCQWDRDCVKGNHCPTIKLTPRQSR